MFWLATHSRDYSSYVVECVSRSRPSGSFVRAAAVDEKKHGRLWRQDLRLVRLNRPDSQLCGSSQGRSTLLVVGLHVVIASLVFLTFMPMSLTLMPPAIIMRGVFTTTHKIWDQHENCSEQVQSNFEHCLAKKVRSSL